MHKLLTDSVDTALELRPLVSNANHCDIVVAPVFTALQRVADRLDGSNVAVAAQDCSSEQEHSAHTGEVCADMVKDAGAEYVIVGHSERRQLNCETDGTVNKKAKASIANGLWAIVCVGEELKDREGGSAGNVVKEQLAGSLEGLTVSDMASIIIAYEPVWAIGTGKTATPGQAQEMHAYIRRSLAGVHGDETAACTRILYGGSVKPDNIRELMDCADIDGALVGGASLDAKVFANIVNYS